MRQHLEHLAAALATFILALFISYFNTGSHAVTFNKVPAASSLFQVENPDTAFTPALVPDLTIPTSTFETLVPSLRATTTPTKSAPAPKPAKPSLPVPPPTRPAVATGTTSHPATSTPTDSLPAPLLSTLSGSIVNILCISHKPPLRGTSGTGVIIDSRGVILTVAHVAQSILLEETLGSDVISCAIRTGSPARTAYHARLIYINEAWLRKNSTTLISTQPTGTGENDFALLAITGTATNKPLPATFPAVPFARSTPDIGQAVGIGSYGAQYLTSTEVRNNLTPTLLMGSVKDIFTFDAYTADVLSILGGSAAQEGSSGGAVVDTNGNLLGIITTSEISGSEATRQLRVITPGHMSRSFSAATGKNFTSYYDNKSLESYVNEYAGTVQTLGLFLAGAIGLR